MVAPRNSAGAWYFFHKGNFAALRRRVQDLRDIGARFVRFWIPWSEVEKEEGRFDFSYIDDVISTIAATGLRLDIMLCTLMAPKWFWQNRLSARPENERGEALYRPSPDRVQSACLSLWHPQARQRTAAFIDKCFGLCLDKWAPLILFVRISMGRFNEPNYPDARHFWCYDDWAAAHFRDRLKEKYEGNIAAFNLAWGTRYAAFRDVVVPKPAQFKAMTAAGRADFIDWYRDAKDEFVLWTIKTLKARLQPYQTIVVYPAGSDDADVHRQDFVRDAKLHPTLRQMARNYWLVGQCRELGLAAQYAGLGVKVNEVFLKQLVKRCRDGRIPLYGQIPGLKSRCEAVNDPEAIAQLVVRFGLHGLGWNKDKDVFDTPTKPKERFNRLKRAFELIDRHYGVDVSSPVLSGIRHVTRGNAATIEWTTDKPCDGVVIYGTRRGFLSSLSPYERTFVPEHSVELSGLRPGVPYSYIVSSMAQDGHASCGPERTFILGG
jgi:hypothetical protein